MEVVRKDIKNLHVGVYPPAGRVRVAAPLRLNDEAVRLAVISRLGWICRRQSEFAEQDRQSQRELVTGESHYFEGRRYRLDLVEGDGRPSVTLRGNNLGTGAAEVVVGDYLFKTEEKGSKSRSPLTSRERQVLVLLAEGMSTKEIALKQGVSVRTIETCRRQLMDKLSVRSVAGLTRYAIREGLTSLGS